MSRKPNTAAGPTIVTNSISDDLESSSEDCSGSVIDELDKIESVV